MKSSIEPIIVKQMKSQLGIDPNSSIYEVSELDILSIEHINTYHRRTKGAIILLKKNTRKVQVWEFIIEEGNYLDGYKCDFIEIDYEAWCHNFN